MLSEEMKNNIMKFVDNHNVMLYNKTASKNEWDEYFKTYSDGCDYVMDDQGFLFFQEKPDHIFIKDFIAFGEGYGLINKIINKNKTIYATVHMTNFPTLNLALRRFKFEIEGIQNGQYIIRKEAKHG